MGTDVDISAHDSSNTSPDKPLPVAPLSPKQTYGSEKK